MADISLVNPSTAQEESGVRIFLAALLQLLSKAQKASIQYCALLTVALNSFNCHSTVALDLVAALSCCWGA